MIQRLLGIVSIICSMALLHVRVAAAAPIAVRDASHTYNVMVKENGRANAFLLVNGLGLGGKGGTYQVALPVSWTGDVRAWYVDEGVFQRCAQQQDSMYQQPQYPCWEAVRSWVPIDVRVEGGKATIAIPKTKGHVTLGISWMIEDMTKKEWWGRRVTIVTPTVDHFVSYVNVAVSFPDGIYIRDNTVGPSRWGDMNAGVSLSNPSVGADMKTAISPEVFDMIGASGDVVKNGNNLAPGESFSVTLFTATSRWKLFVSEICTALIVAVSAAVVVSLILRLLVGKKPFWWYLSIVVLFLVLAGLVLWLFQMLPLLFPREDYPIMFKQEMAPSVERLDRTVTGGEEAVEIKPL